MSTHRPILIVVCLAYRRDTRDLFSGGFFLPYRFDLIEGEGVRFDCFYFFFSSIVTIRVVPYVLPHTSEI